MEAASIIFTEKAEPRNYNEAMKSEDAVEWKAAIEEEVNSLFANQTWTLVKYLEGRNIIGCKWVFKVKPGYAGFPERYMARLVAKGFTQFYGTDYNEIFSPVLKYNSLRTILAIPYTEIWISLFSTSKPPSSMAISRKKCLWYNPKASPHLEEKTMYVTKEKPIRSQASSENLEREIQPLPCKVRPIEK